MAIKILKHRVGFGEGPFLRDVMGFGAPLVAEVAAAKADVAEGLEKAKEQRTPNGLTEIRRLVTDYYENPAKFIDWATKQDDTRYDRKVDSYVPEVKFLMRSFEDATGLTKLGNGHYSDVYAIDETRVLKIVKSSDVGYERYANFCRDKKNPHLPRIFYSSTWGGKRVYVLERLSVRPETRDHSETYSAFYAALRTNGKENPFMTLAKHVAEIAAFLEEHQFANDIRSDNILYRGDVPVVTDPCSDG